MIEDGDRAAGKAALGEERGALHEEHHIIVADEVGDAGVGVTHC
jgi:hypothetical protein